jgi:hypothetical protein
MVGQFPHGIDLHVRNLQWALSEDDHSYIVTPGSFIKDFNLRNSDRVTFIPFGERHDIRTWLPFWAEFPNILRGHGIDAPWVLLMEQDIWFYLKIKDDPPPGPKEIRSHLPLSTDYHAVLRDNELYHPRVWEGGILVHRPLLLRAVDFGVDFSGHDDWFIKKDKAYWDQRAGGRLSLSEYENADTMDELTLYCALVEETRMTHCPRAVHLQGPEVLHRNNPKAYHAADKSLIQALIEYWYGYFCVHTALAVYFIAGNWRQEADWTRVQPHCKPLFRALTPSAKEWMKAEEYERLERVVACL